MTSVFLRIVNISFTAGWLILAVIALRLLLRKAPKWLICLLWALVALRLLIPFSIESALSLIPSNEVISESIVSNQAPSIDTGFVVVNNTVNPIISDTFSSETQVSHNPIRIFVSIASIVWIIGIAMMLVYAIISFGKLKRQVSTAIPFEKESYSYRTFVCDDIQSPFILGIIKPLIFIPSSLDEETIGYVYAHENAHIKRHDHWWKPLGFLLLSVYWFNPLCWVAYILLCKDIEAACDEKVIKDKDKSYLALYSQALLECAVQRKRISACPLAFGETGVKSRVKGILSYKKPAFWIIVIAVVAIIVAAVCFLTNPKKKEDWRDTLPELIVSLENDDTYYEADIRGYAWALNDEKEKKEKDISDVKLHTDFDESVVKIISKNEGSNKVIFQFLNEPDKVEVKGMEDEYVGNPDEYKNYVFDLDYNPENHSVDILSESGLFVTVNASWDNQGHVSYVFHIIPSSNDNVLNDGIIVENGDYVYENNSENMGINYEYVDGQYVVDGDEVFMYRKILVGKDNNAKCPGKFIVLTNNPDITYEKVAKSLYSSNSDDWLKDTVIIGMEALTESFDCFAIWPTKSTKISAEYDEKNHPETDISGKTGDPIYAIADGTVIFAGWEEGYGNTVKLLSSNAVIEYHHLNSISVKECDEVRARDVIGELGNTGLSTGPHLGISLMVNGDSKNLVDYYVENTQTGYIEIKPAKINTEAPFAYATPATILFANKKMIIFSAEYGLFVYSKEDMAVKQSIDLTYIGCDYTQGDNYCEKFVSADGESVYLHPINEDYMFVYAIRSNTLRKDNYNLSDIELHKLPTETIEQIHNSVNYDTYMDGGVKKITYLVQGATIGDLYYADLDYDLVTGKSIVDPLLYPFFYSTSAGLTKDEYNFTADIELPEGYILSTFYPDQGYGGCFYINPLQYEPGEYDEGTPNEWIFTGMFGKAPSNITNVTFKSGIPELSGVRIENHTTANYLEVIGLERSNNQWPAIMLEESHDLYTAAGIEKLKGEGTDISKIDLTSDYWYFWFVKEGADNYYVLSLSKKEFSKEEAINIAKTVIIKE